MVCPLHLRTGVAILRIMVVVAQTPTRVATQITVIRALMKAVSIGPKIHHPLLLLRIHPCRQGHSLALSLGL